MEVNESPDAEAALEGGIGRFDLHCRCTGGTQGTCWLCLGGKMLRLKRLY